MAYNAIDTSGWDPAVTPTTANLGLPTATMSGGSLNDSGSSSWHYATDADGDVYLFWDGIAAASTNGVYMVAAGEVLSYLDADGKAVRFVWDADIMLDADTGKNENRTFQIFGSNPDLRARYGITAGTGDSELDFENDGRHFQFDLTDTANAPAKAPKNPRYPFGRRFTLEWYCVRNGSTYDYAISIDGRVVMAATGITDFTAEANRARWMQWKNVGDGLSTTYARVRLYGGGFEEYASGGWSNFLGSVSPQINRATASRTLGAAFSAAQFDGDFDVSGLSNLAADYAQAHDAWTGGRGFNGYPYRFDCDKASVCGSLVSRDTDLVWPTDRGRCAALWMISRISDTASGAAGAYCDFIDTNGLQFGIGWDSTTGSAARLKIKYDTGGFPAYEDTGIDLDIDRAWALYAFLSSGALTVVAVDWTETSNANRAVWWHTSAQVSGIPTSAFKVKISLETSNISPFDAAPGTLSFIGVALLPRVPLYAESSYANGSATGTGDDTGTFRRCANICAAAGDAFGVHAIASIVDELGRLDSSGNLRPGSRSPGFALAMEGLSVKELTQNTLAGDTAGFFAAAHAVQFLLIDGKVNGLDDGINSQTDWDASGAQNIADTEAATKTIRDAAVAAGVDLLLARTPSPGVDGTTWLADQAAAMTAVGDSTEALPGPYWWADLVAHAGSEAAATAAYMTTGNVHPENDYAYHDDLFAAVTRRHGVDIRPSRGRGRAALTGRV